MNLHDPNERAHLSLQILNAVENDCVEEYQDGHRTHLGISVIGRECKRELWNSFRWIANEQFNGQKLRLFNRGHREEPAIIHRLNRIGIRVDEIDPETGKQYRVANLDGHYGGSCDGKAYLPEFTGITEALIAEFKTHGEKSYADLAGKITSKWPTIERTNPKGVKESKPEHFAQMSSYGAAMGLRFGIYLAVNKNTDEIYIEVVELDWTLAEHHLNTAKEIVYGQVPPKKLSNSKTFYKCRMCHFNPYCHDNKAPEKNCRSCDNASATTEKGWYCRVNDARIPGEVIPVGCDSYRRII